MMVRFMSHAICLLVCSIVIEAELPLPDWLVEDIQTPTQLKTTASGNLLLTNGIIQREFSLKPDFGTVDFYSVEKEASILRAISPEAVIALDGVVYNISSLQSPSFRGYLNRTALAEDLVSNPKAFRMVSYVTKKPEAPYKYTPKRGAPANITWPPNGLRLDVEFRAPSTAPASHRDVNVTVHYEMYDGIPLMTKWLSVKANSQSSQVILTVSSVEYLAINQQFCPDGLSSSLGPLLGTRIRADPIDGYGWLFVESDTPHAASVFWEQDPEKLAMPGAFVPALNATYQHQPSWDLGRESYESYKVHELVTGTSEPERFGLARRRKLRLLAPQTMENPIFFEMKNFTTSAVRSIIDQIAATGFEMMIYSSGTGFDLESDNDTYLDQIAADVAYAHKKGIEMGGYDLISLARTKNIKPEWIAQPEKGKSVEGACFASGWYDYLLKKVLTFLNRTGVSMIETDGPYGGYSCVSTTHAHHKGLGDSVYMQDKLQSTFYKTLREKGIFINQPDRYFYHGANKATMGYSEWQYALPRWQDLSISRQGMFDDTFHYTPTAGWMVVPLWAYHKSAHPEDTMFQPVHLHKTEYNFALGQYFGAGVAACFSGDNLFDDQDTKDMVTKWVSFFKKYRDILTSDIIHVRRADMQGIDAFMHVNPRLSIKGLLMVYNPLTTPETRVLKVPLYYTGLTTTATVCEQAQNCQTFNLDRQFNIYIKVQLGQLSITWFLIH